MSTRSGEIVVGGVPHPLGEALWKLLVAEVPYLAGLPAGGALALGAILVPLLDVVGRRFLGWLITSQLVTMAEGYHAEFDNDNPARPPRFKDRHGKEV